MMRRKREGLLLLPLAAWLAAAAPAAAGETDYARYREVRVWLTPDTYVNYLCSGHPAIIPGQTEWTLRADGTTVRFDKSAAVALTFPMGDTADAVRDARREATVLVTDRELRLSDMRPGTPVSVYAADGRLALTRKAGGEGAARLDISSLRPGVYVARAGNVTLKFQKR